MAARRLIMAMVVLLVISSVAAALVPVERSSESSSTQATTVDRPDPSGELVNRTMSASAAKPKTIEIKLGDQLALRVTSKVADQVEIPALGEFADVERDAPARFDLLPFEPGRYAVRLVEARKTVGRIVVEPQGGGARKPESPAGGPEDNSTESPGSSTTALTPGARSAS